MWKRLLIDDYDKKNDIYIAHWLENNEEVKLKRIYFCLDAEDPRKYVKRVAHAF